MFTGLIQAVGNVLSLSGGRFEVRYPPGAWNDGFELGESVAVNGCCLTVVSDSGTTLHFDLSEETLDRTTLGDCQTGKDMNLERAMRPIDRFGGHIVQGHVDAVAQLESIQKNENSWLFRFTVPDSGGRYLIDKGSIALDGISLTVVEPHQNSFSVAIIPHTMSATTLVDAVEGQRFNVEYDVLAKHVEKLMSSAR